MREWLKNVFGRSAARPEVMQATADEGAAAQLRRGNEFLDAGRLDEALACYQASVSAHETAAGFVNLGFVLKEMRRPAEAAQALEQALRLDHRQFDATYLLAELAAEAGNLPLAADRFALAAELQPDSQPALRGLITASLMAGDTGRARTAAEAGIAAHPGEADFHFLLGNVLAGQRALPEAMARWQEAVRLRPGHAEGHNQLGNALLSLGRHDEAASHYRAAIAADGAHAVAHANLGLALLELKQPEAADKSIRRAITLQPSYARGHHNLGNVLSFQGALDDAVAAYRQAVALDPSLAQAHYNMAVALNALGREDEAFAGWRAALALEPGNLDARIGLLYPMSFAPGSSPADYLREALEFGRACAARARPFTQWRALLAPPRTGHPLRVGFVSGDFHAHPVAYFLEAALRHVDPARLTLIAYSNGALEDAVTARLKPLFAQWNSILGMDDAAAAAAIEADDVHVLIDLAGLTATQRLALFAWRPAPVQATWLGYFATTGIPGIDYLIADTTGVPPEHRMHFSETVRYMPQTRLCFSAPEGACLPRPNALPALGNGYLTFGCFQNSIKLNDGVLALWGQVFRTLPEARLRHQSKQMSDPAKRETLLRRLEQHGISRDRVEMAGATSREQYFTAYHGVDVMLDTFPYCGGTTTCEALWMGVPTLTLAGDTLLSRQGASLLMAGGLEDWIARDEAGYVRALARHCADLPALAKLRAGLREKVLASPLFDGERFAADLQALLHSMWQEKGEGAAAQAT